MAKFHDILRLIFKICIIIHYVYLEEHPSEAFLYEKKIMNQLFARFYKKFYKKKLRVMVCEFAWLRGDHPITYLHITEHLNPFALKITPKKKEVKNKNL